MTTVGLVHYWPISSDLKDYVGTDDLVPGTNLEAGGSVGFGPDRFNNPNSALYLSNAYCSLPPDIYFNGSFSVLAWVKVVEITNFARLIDFANGESSDNVIIALSNGFSGDPYVTTFEGDLAQNVLVSPVNLIVDNWHHLAVVLDPLGNNYIYIDAILVASISGVYLPNTVNRTECFLGRSSWYPGDHDANANFDDIKIYNLALTQADILNDMNLPNQG